MVGTYDLAPGALVVLEGLDKAGKTTQANALQAVLPDTLFTHQPSGGNVVGATVYELTEAVTAMSPVARQFLHLASHAEHYERELIPTLSTGGVVMDRCWWSTIAYGYFGSGLRFAMDYPLFEEMCCLPTQGVMPKVVFVFMSPWAEDRHNNSEVLAGYHSLIERFNEVAVVVPKDSVEKVTRFIVEELARRNLLVRVQ